MKMSAKCCDVQPSAIEFRRSVDVGVMLTQQLHNVVMTFVACVVEGCPFIETLPVDLYRVVVLSLLNDVPRLIIQSLLAIVSKPVVVTVHVHPKPLPLD